MWDNIKTLERGAVAEARCYATNALMRRLLQLQLLLLINQPCTANPTLCSGSFGNYSAF